MKIEEIRTTYNIIVNSQAEHNEIIDYLETLGENVSSLKVVATWDKICFFAANNRWQLLDEDYGLYKLPPITFNQLKDMLTEEEEWIPKAGDWIVATESYTHFEKGLVAQINDSTNYPLSDFNTSCFDISKYIGKSCMPYKKGCRKALPHEIPKEEVLSEDSLIEEAKKRYPVGTKFYPAHTAHKREYCIITDDSVFVDQSGIMYSKIGGHVFSSSKDPKYGNTGYNRVIYYGGKWADIIVEEPTQCEEVNLVGRYLKALIDYPNSGNVKKGEYGIITDSTCIMADFPSQKNYACSSALTMPERYELMPEGFNPNSISGTSKFKVGVWYKNTEDGDYGKLCSEVTKDRFPATEYIDSLTFVYRDNGTYFDEYWMDNLIEADLSEIQKYLPDGHPDKQGSSAYHVDFGDSNLPLPEAFSYESGEPEDTIISRAIMLSSSGIAYSTAYYFGSDPYKPDLDELKSSTIKLKTIEVRKLKTN